MESNLWNDVLEVISKRVSRATFETWFKVTNATKDGKEWLITAPNDFAKIWLKLQYSPLIREVIYEITQEIPEVVFAVEEKIDNKIENIISQIRYLEPMDKEKLFGLLKGNFPLYSYYFSENGTSNFDDKKHLPQIEQNDAELQLAGHPPDNHYHSKGVTILERLARLEKEVEQLKNQI